MKTELSPEFPLVGSLTDRWRRQRACLNNGQGVRSFPTSGTYTSAVYDSGRASVQPQDISWVADIPADTSVSLQVASSSTPTPSSWEYVGPDGTSATYFTTSGSSMANVPANRYFRYQATLTGSGTVTPRISDVEISLAGANPSTLKAMIYDPCGNLVSLATNTSFAVTGTITSSSDTVTSVSSADIANLFVGAAVNHPDFASGTTVSSISTSSFVVSNSATGSASDAAIIISGSATDIRNNFVIGTVTSGSATVTNVSSADIASLTTGNTLVSTLFPGSITVSTIGTDSFTVSNNATASATNAVIPFTNGSWSSGDLINNLNQILRQETTPLGSATVTTTAYEYDDSGNMTSKSNGTNSWTYSWDEDNRLLEVAMTGPGAYTVTYTYDAQGRMLTRYDGTNTTKFEWDGWTMVRETTGSTVTTYYAPLGELFEFDINGTPYFVHTLWDRSGKLQIIQAPQ